ncbi:hypothetical protein [Bacillus cereus]|uniref:hypothetical protein n=1 Tax=Bacillus cereus TaxID=1396 RepID=UPI0024057282|nr:hypothetical protein [Bacillus cereus]MDF9507989.1 hypothetical protein [Bacillus cereus]MDF9595310.1 hypothetical protein [Bacillus cereus]MDF9609705.1 hypothetical protein [Bacillus cereus]MDF9659675.1 hypothetical protein [Bacillus cereus]
MSNYLKIQESAKRIYELSKHQQILEREKNILKSELYKLLKEKRDKENFQGIRTLDI